MELQISPEWIIYAYPFLIEYVIKPVLGTLYSEIWCHVKKWWSSRKTRRYQSAKVGDGRQTFPAKEYILLDPPEGLFFLLLHSFLYSFDVSFTLNHIPD